VEPELVLEPNFLQDATQLYSSLVETVAWEEHIKARKTATFGTPYNYSGIIYTAVPMHSLLVPIVHQLTSRLRFEPNNCLLNYYETGDSTMGFHADSTVDLAPDTGIAIISLGAQRSITFRHGIDREKKFHYPLPNGSLLYMSQEIQQNWQHAILKQPETGGRISLTFRQLLSSAL
jgi:alkylated DNA repair dioxygenase AlkB